MLIDEDQVMAQQISFGDFQLLTGETIDGRNKMVDFFMCLWREKGGLDHTITRQDIHPAEMKRYLEHLVILDVEQQSSDWSLRVRLIGGYVANFYGELTGKDVRDMKNTQAVARIYQACARVLETKSAVLTTSPAFAPERLHLEAIALYMPLFDADTNVEKILICVNITTQE